MAKKKPVKKMGGPFLAVAVFCENTIQGDDRSMSIIKIIDGVNIVIPPQAPDNFPSPSQPFPVIQNILLTFRTGDSPGNHTVKLLVESPDGTTTSGQDLDFTLPPEPHGGMNLKTLATIGVHENGVHLVDVILDGNRVTRMPFNVQITRAELPTLLPDAAGKAKPPPKAKKKG